MSFKRTLALFTGMLFVMVLLSILALFGKLGASDIVKNIFSEEIRYSLMLSVVTGFISTIMVVISAIPVAYFFSRYSMPGLKIIKTILYLPMAFPEIVLGLCLLLLFGHPVIKQFLSAFGISVVFSKTGIVVAQYFTALPYAISTLTTVFSEVDMQQELVSRSLGYSQLQTIRHVTLPLAKKGIAAATTIVFARCVGAFGSVLILAGGSRMSSETLPISLYLNLSYGNMDMAITSGLVLVFIAFAGLFAIEIIEGNISAGAKESSCINRWGN